MGLFQAPIGSLFRRDKAASIEQGMNLGRAASAPRPSVQVGEFLAIVVIISMLGLTVYCMVSGRSGKLTEMEFDVFKQYAWFAVSVAAGLAVNGGMGRFNYYSGGSFQAGGAVTPQPGAGSVAPGTVMDPWAGMQGEPFKLPQDSFETAMSDPIPVDLSGGQDDSGSPIDIHGPRSDGDG